MEYFSHDYNPREDEKVKNLMYKHGWVGYGIFWGIVESLYQNDGYMQTHYERIAYEMRIDIKILESVINDFGLFKIKENAFYSESVLHRLKLRRGKSIKAKKAAESRWHKEKQNDANAMQTHSESNAIKEKEKKEKKTKKNTDIPDITEFMSYAKTLEVYKPEYDFSLKSKYETWVSSGWKDGNDKKINNWKLKVKNVFPFLKPVYTNEKTKPNKKDDYDRSSFHIYD